jgi:hypothetical protein
MRSQLRNWVERLEGPRSNQRWIPGSVRRQPMADLNRELERQWAGSNLAPHLQPMGNAQFPQYRSPASQAGRSAATRRYSGELLQRQRFNGGLTTAWFVPALHGEPKRTRAHLDDAVSVR